MNNFNENLQHCAVITFESLLWCFYGCTNHFSVWARPYFWGNTAATLFVGVEIFQKIHSVVQLFPGLNSLAWNILCIHHLFQFAHRIYILETFKESFIRKQTFSKCTTQWFSHARNWKPMKSFLSELSSIGLWFRFRMRLLGILLLQQAEAAFFSICDGTSGINFVRIISLSLFPINHFPW